MLEAVLVKSITLKNVLEAVKDLLTQAEFDFDVDGVHMQAIDSAHLSLVSLKLRAVGFDHYSCDREITMGVNLKSMSNIFKCANDNDTVTIRAQDNPDKVAFLFKSLSEEWKVTEFEMRLMNLNDERLSIPETRYSCSIRLPSRVFTKICHDLKFAESMVISCTKEAVTFSAVGDIESCNIKCALTKDSNEEDKVVIMDMQEEVSLRFSCKYLEYFTKAASLSPLVQLSMSADYPLLVKYCIADIGHINFYLASKVGDEN